MFSQNGWKDRLNFSSPREFFDWFVKRTEELLHPLYVDECIAGGPTNTGVYLSVCDNGAAERNLLLLSDEVVKSCLWINEHLRDVPGRPAIPDKFGSREEAARKVEEIRVWLEKVLAGGEDAGQVEVEKPRSVVTKGPVEPNMFAWPGCKPATLEPTPFRLLRELWDNGDGQILEIVERVWDRDASDKAIERAIFRINNSLLAAEIPVSVSRKTGYFVLSGRDK